MTQIALPAGSTLQIALIDIQGDDLLCKSHYRRPFCCCFPKIWNKSRLCLGSRMGICNLLAWTKKIPELWETKPLSVFLIEYKAPPFQKPPSFFPFYVSQV